VRNAHGLVKTERQQPRSDVEPGFRRVRRRYHHLDSEEYPRDLRDGGDTPTATFILQENAIE